MRRDTTLRLVVAVALAGVGRRFGRRAALRGLLASSIASAIVDWVARRWSRHPQYVRVAPLAAFSAGAAQELPWAGLPLGAITGAAGWRAVRSRERSSTDVAAAVALGAAVAVITRRVWPVAPRTPAQIRPALTPLDAEPSSDGEGLSVVVNPGAGPALSRNPADALRDELPAAEILEIGEHLDLATALKKASLNARAIGIAGGDGTVGAGAAVAAVQDKPLVVVPAGTLNHLARDLGLTGVDDAIEAVKNGTTVAVDVALIGERTFLNTASFGAYVELVDARERLEHKVGKWPAVLVALAQVLRRGEPCRVELDGRERLVWMIFIGNCRYHPAGFTPSWRERLDDGQLDIRVVDGTHPFSRSRLLLAVLTGRLARTAVYDAWHARELRVRSLQGPMRLASDGETFDGPEEFVVRKRGKPLSVYVPR